MSDTRLTDRHCQSETNQLDSTAVQALMAEIHADWSLSEDGQMIQRIFRFKNYYQTIAFVNALAWVAHQQDHHPDLEVGYNRCVVHYSTHSVGGLSENDFICAAGIDALVPGDA
ncbi:MAG: 4a-hydroxytetrahydrobiopterin dehydratase [Gammaproteobacteria bacterium]|nr:MAG: 4a-hydroxytetrahydrobiopterin dehydratase [Gammaproteobacteria bacterium]